MSNVFVRPSYLHDPDRVLSATSEAGLTVAPPTPGTGNSGSLVLRTSGIPTQAATCDVKLQTGGNPSGYALTTGSGQGRGAAAIWKYSTDAGTLYRGYIDTPYLTKIVYPCTYGTGLGKPSKPRTLPDGFLGFVVHHSPGTASAMTFYRISHTYAATSATIEASTTTSSSQSDFVVLPSGRLVVIRLIGTALTRYTSDDYGATWSSSTACGSATGTHDTVSLEYVNDQIVMVLSDSTAGTATDIRISDDEGYNWTSVDTATTLRTAHTCVTPTGSLLVASTQSAYAWQVAPGGGLDSNARASTALTDSANSIAAIATRDDGTIWAFCTNTSATATDIDASVSLDGGLTFTNPLAGLRVADLDSDLTNNGFRSLTAGCWEGRVILLTLGQSAGTASDYAVHMLVLGGWESVTEGIAGSAIYTYDHCMIPFDYPDNLATPWTRTNTGAGAAVTNQGPLKFVSTLANNTYFLAPTGIIAASNAGGTYRVRFRARVTAGGDVAANVAGLRVSVSDGGGNHQGFALRMATTGFRVVDIAATFSNSTTVDMTAWTDFLFAFKHDNVANTSGLLSCWYKQDADDTWTLAFAAGTIGESAVPGNSQVRIGGSAVTATCTWECAYFGLSDSSYSMQAGFTNPTDLQGRPLSSSSDYHLTRQIYVGGRNALGVAGDTYTVATTYNYGKADVWRELRPSRHCRSSADNTAWDWRGYSGASDNFRGNIVALFGTNFRTCSFQLNTADSWGAPAVTVSLDATITSGTVGAGNRGLGYFGPTASPSWVPGQFRSDGDAHRFFVDVGGTVYEITDNDADRLYVADVNFAAAAGTFYVFGDRMAATTSFAQYQYMRVSVGSQDTADGHYKLGTVIFDQTFTPAVTYDETFTDRVTPTVEAFSTDAGYSARARRGPRRYSTQIAWSPINALRSTTSTLFDQIRAFYTSIEGSLTPIVWWRDTTDIQTLSLVYVEGVLAAPNVKGELKKRLARVDQLELIECI